MDNIYITGGGGPFIVIMIVIASMILILYRIIYPKRNPILIIKALAFWHRLGGATLRAGRPKEKGFWV